jgi:hypothetical protein
MAREYPEKPRSPLQEALRDLQEEILELRRKQAASDAQVQRIQRTVRVDEREFNIGKMQSERAVLDSVAALTQAVNAMVLRQEDPQERVDQEGHNLWLASKDDRVREVNHHLGELYNLRAIAETCDVEHTLMCPCGNHQGMRFVDKADHSIVLIDNECPQQWWFSMSRLAFAEGRLKQYNETVKLPDLLSEYNL